MTIKLNPYVIEKKLEPMPLLVKAFVDGEFKDTLAAYSVEILKESENTGQGMSYKNRLILRHDHDIIYDTGMVTYRDGRSGYPTDYDKCYRKAGIASKGNILIGIETGTGKVSITNLYLRKRVALYDVEQAKRDALNGSIDPTKLSDLRAHFKNIYNRGEQYPWTIGSEDIVCDCGTGFMAFHNGQSGRGGEVWDKCVVVIIHDGKPYISDPVPISLSGDNWSLSHLMSRSIEGNKFKCGFVCCRHDSWIYNFTPTIVEFEIKFEV